MSLTSYTDEIRVLSPTAILGYGFPLESFRAGLAAKPHVIAVDAGSSDPGPYYLGAGVSFTDREAVKRDLRHMLTAATRAGIPLIVGSAGGAGGTPHLEWTADIVRDIAREEGLSFALAVIDSEIDKADLLEANHAGRVAPCGVWPELTDEDITSSTRMGHEPIVDALAKGAQGIVAGRAYDPAVFAALPIAQGFDPGLATHLGKILECAAIACTPGSGSDCMLGILRQDHFLVRPLNEVRACTVASVSAHTLYEKSDPYRLPGPGGLLDLTQTRFDQVDERTVRVSGSRHVATPYAVKVEGAALTGYRTLSIAGVRDPIFIGQLDAIVASVKERLRDNFADLSDDAYVLIVRAYGRDGVMGELEPQRARPSHELGLVIEVVARSQDLANTICGFVRSTLLHFGYPGRVSTAGNLAFPHSPSDVKAGAVYRFSVYHLLPTNDPLALVRSRFEQIGRATTEATA